MPDQFDPIDPIEKRGFKKFEFGKKRLKVGKRVTNRALSLPKRKKKKASKRLGIDASDPTGRRKGI